MSAERQYVATTPRGRQMRQAAPDLTGRAVRRLTGHEALVQNRRAVARVQDFWQWCDSDLLSNSLRGRFAEYLVALDLGVADGVRTEWQAYDLTSSAGIKVEVKSASYIQSWVQRRHSSIAFDVRPTLAWNSDTERYDIQRLRQADVYVFALLDQRERPTADPLVVDDWRFLVIATKSLNAGIGLQKSVSLARLEGLKPRSVAFGGIRAAVEEAVLA